MSKVFLTGKIILTKLFLLFFLNVSLAQDKFSVHASQVQLEVLGPAGAFSFNFDSRFGKQEAGLGLRIGLGGMPLSIGGVTCNSGTLISLPAGLNYLLGKGQHLFETGAGTVLAVISSTKVYCPGLKSGFFSDETQSYFYLLTGYRYQPVKKKGTTFRIFVSPLFQKDFPMKFWGGISLGRRF